MDPNAPMNIFIDIYGVNWPWPTQPPNQRFVATSGELMSSSWCTRRSVEAWTHQQPRHRTTFLATSRQYPKVKWSLCRSLISTSLHVIPRDCIWRVISRNSWNQQCSPFNLRHAAFMRCSRTRLYEFQFRVQRLLKIKAWRHMLESHSHIMTFPRVNSSSSSGENRHLVFVSQLETNSTQRSTFDG